MRRAKPYPRAQHRDRRRFFTFWDLDVKWFWAGMSHPACIRIVGSFSSERTTAVAHAKMWNAECGTRCKKAAQPRQHVAVSVSSWNPAYLRFRSREAAPADALRRDSLPTIETHARCRGCGAGSVSSRSLRHSLALRHSHSQTLVGNLSSFPSLPSCMPPASRRLADWCCELPPAAVKTPRCTRLR